MSTTIQSPTNKSEVDGSQSVKTAVPSQSVNTFTKAETEVKSRPVLRPMDETKPAIKNPQPSGKGKKIFFISLSVVIILLGSATGYAFAIIQGGSSLGGNNSNSGLKREVATADIGKGTKVGIADESTFSDSAEGVLEKGGIDGEGSHHLVRPGGEDQTLYMTSSVIDLDQFVGKKVKVWGETLGAQTAGWLMDTGKLEVLE